MERKETPEDDIDLPEQEEEEEESEKEEESEDDEEAEEERKRKSENCASITWKLTDFASLDKEKQKSEHFSAGKQEWYILLFPKGNSTKGVVSCYLAVEPNKETTPRYGWSIYGKFSITFINHKDPALTLKKETKHRFSRDEKDWGFNSIISFAKICDPASGFLDKEGNLQVECSVEVLPYSPYSYGSSRYYFQWDSKKETGFVGLKNQGATCYMNSLLQALYSLSTFRKAVYEMPTMNDSPTSSIPLALQRVFYRLQFSKQNVGTKELTKSFGWTTRDSFIQQDVQELNRVFCDNLEEKMKGTTSEGIIQRLFQGKLYNYIRCVDVAFESRRGETFLDLSLQIKGMNDVYDSFEKYCEDERLEGDNQYDAGKFGKQDADMGCNFQELPPVLELHLKRFIFDFERERNVKINDRYEYPSLLKLNRFMHPDADKTLKNNYRLHCVLVHSGDVHGGHYYAYVRPTLKNKWFKFDDDRVTKATSKQVFENNFGGEVPYTQYVHGQRQTVTRKKSANAYMLIYVRTSAREQIFAEVGESEIPAHLQERFEMEEAERVKKAQEQREAHLYIRVKVATIDDMEKHHRTDLVAFDELDSFKVKKKSTLKEFREKIAEVMDIPVERQRYWNWQGRRNGTVRPDEIYSPREEDSPLETFLKRNTDLKVFLEMSKAPEGTTDPDELFSPVPDDHALILLKTYEPENSELNFLTYTFLPKNEKVKKLIPLVREKMGWPEDRQILVFEEIKPSMIDQVDTDHTITEAELGNGDILTFQLDIDDASKYRHALATDFYSYMLNRVVVSFRELSNPKEDVFSLELAKNMTYDDVSAQVAAKIECEPLKIRFTQHSSMSDRPRIQAVKRNPKQKLTDLLHNPYSRGKLLNVLYYEKLEVSIVELESKKCIKVHWYNGNVQKESTELLLLEKDSHITDAIDEMKSRVKMEGTGIIRIMDVHNCKIYRILKPEERTAGIHELYTTLRAEEIPKEEIEMEEGDVRIQVVHRSRDPPRHHTFGDPFFFVLKKGEEFVETKKRLLERLALTEEETAKYKFAIVPSYLGKVTYIKDDMVLADRKWHSTNVLALEHVDKSRAPSKKNVGIVING